MGGGTLLDDPAAPEMPRNAFIRAEVVNYPLKYLAKRIGGERVEVGFGAPAEVDPASWSPDAGVIAAFQEADLVLLNGAGYARWIDTVSLPLSRLVDTSRGFRDRYINVDSAGTHTHGPEGEHSHGELAFTTWLDPLLAIEHARAIRDAFAAARPTYQAEFESGFAALEADLRALDQALEVSFAALGGAPLVASHPVYRYLARRYRLDLRSVHFEPDEPPDEKGWRQLEEILKSRPSRWMIWEGEPLASTAERLAALGVGVIVFDPCPMTPAVGDLLTVMHDNVRRVVEASDKGNAR